ncbi:MAG TPA: sigma-70 family RNA polymerase sigma factor [Planctomycetota bacterium]|nr:sigma-70 family RNA polymerase sigma factor [Planctomycetota bacterium]
MVMADPPATPIWSAPAATASSDAGAADADSAPAAAEKNRLRRQEEVLVARARAGDAQAFEQLMLHCQDRLYGFITKTCGNADDAQDLFQDTVLRAFKHIADFQAKSSFSTWLHTIAYHLWCSRVRKEAGRGKPEDGAAPRPKVIATGEILDSQAVDHTAPDDGLYATEIQIQVRTAVRSLEEPDQTIIVMREFGGHSYEEIAEVTGMQLGAIKSRIHRARRKLAEMLKGFLESDA